MLWMTWRQHRAQMLVTAGFLLAFGVFLLVHGISTNGLRAGVAADRLEEVLSGRYQSVYTYLSWIPVLPLLVGLFWGAPLLARELERGTHRLAWTQSVTRKRWLATKLGALGLAVTVAGLAIGLMISGWLQVFDGTRFNDRFGDSAMFGATGVAAGAWWLFAFLLGTAAGGLLRRILPALAVTIAVFLLVMIGFMQIRSEYAAPVREIASEDSMFLAADGRYLTGTGSLSPAGVEIAGDGVVPECADQGRNTYLACVADAGYTTVMYYQPADRYWRFQWTETGLLLLLSALVVGPVVYRVSRRPV